MDMRAQLAGIVQRFGADSGTLHFLGEDGLLHLAAATDGLPPPVLETIARIPVGKGMAGLAVERRQPVDACNIQTDASGDVRPGARTTGLAGAIVVPIWDGTEVVGTLGIANRAPRTFEASEVAALLSEGRQLAAGRARVATG